METIVNSLILFGGIASIGLLDPSAADFLEDVCMQPMDAGRRCDPDDERQPSTQYYFSSEKETCLPFDYKGCGGNINRFSVADDCTDACQVDYYKKKNAKHGFLSSVERDEKRSEKECQEAMVQGPCRAMIPQWYFHKESATCKQFSYGGCNGSRNRFNTEEDCQHLCIKKAN